MNSVLYCGAWSPCVSGRIDEVASQSRPSGAEHRGSGGGRHGSFQSDSAHLTDDFHGLSPVLAETGFQRR